MKITVSIQPKADEDIKFPDMAITVEDNDTEAATTAMDRMLKTTQHPLIIVSGNVRSDTIKALAEATKGSVVAK